MGKPSLSRLRCSVLVLISAYLQFAKTQTVIFPDCQTDNTTPSCVVGGAVINNGSVGQTQLSEPGKILLSYFVSTIIIFRLILKLEGALAGPSLQLRR